MQKDALVESLRRTACVLDNLTDKWFLSGGSCLGYVRTGEAIAWDTDIDVGIYDPSVDLRKLARYLPVADYFGIGTRVTVVGIAIGVHVDIILFFDYDGMVAESMRYRDDEVMLCLYPKSVFEAGVKLGVFCGVECNVLKQSPDYCRALYGDSYMIPDPSYNGPKNAVMTAGCKAFTGAVSSIWRKISWEWRSEGTRTVALASTSSGRVWASIRKSNPTYGALRRLADLLPRL